MKETDQHCSNHPNPTIKGCDLLVLSLEREGVETVFAYPGGASLDLHQQWPVVNSASRCRGTNRAAFSLLMDMQSYEVGVCMTTSGRCDQPGYGVANAFADSIPLVLITGQ